MSWFAQSLNDTEAGKEQVCLIIAASFAFSSGTIYVWSGFGDFTYNGNAYLGIGTLGKITPTTEQVTMVAERKTYQLTGVDPALVLESDFDSAYGRSVTENIGFMTAAGVLVAPLEVNWEGRMDSCRRVDGSAPVIEINAEHRLALLDRPDGWRFTHEHQQQFFAGDDGLKQVPTIETTELLWGGFRVYPGSSPGPGGPGRRDIDVF